MYFFGKEFIDFFCRSENVIDYLFEILIIKYQYKSRVQNPSSKVVNIIFMIIQHCKHNKYLQKYQEMMKKKIRENFQNFMFHFFELSGIKFKSKSVKCQGYSLGACLSKEQRIHLELLLEMVIFDKTLAKRVDSYLFQIALYWTLQAL
jgi:hypothetical protein